MARPLGGVDAVKIAGFRELRREMKQIDKGFGKTVRVMHKDIATEAKDETKAAAFAAGSTLAHIAPSITALATQTRAQLKFGGPKWPMAPGAEFGSDRWKQFKPHRGSGDDAGYAIFPTLRRMRQRIEDLATKAVNNLIESLGA